LGRIAFSVLARNRGGCGSSGSARTVGVGRLAMGSCGLRHGCSRKPSRTRTGAWRGIGVVDNHSFGSVSSLFKTGHLVGFGSLGRGRLPIIAGQAVFQPEGARQIRNGKPGLVLLFVSST